MKTNHKLALAVLAGVSLGVAGGRMIHAQQVKTPPAYVIAEVETTNHDPNAMQGYGEKAPGIMAAFGGHYVVRGGKTLALEGEAPKGYIVVIGFDSMGKARAWYDSPDYAAIRPIRQRATKSRLLLAEGVTPQ
jgi:uncharacterized protein (DUF1330 family)